MPPRVLLTALLAGITLAPAPAPAGETMKKLLQVLRDRGTLSEADYRMLVEAADAESPATPPALPSPSAPAGTPAVPGPAGAAASGPSAATVPGAAGPDSVHDAVHSALKNKWYERISFRGYAQLRYTEVLDSEGAPLNVPNDASASDNSSFLLRRGRLILSGNPSDRLSIYLQSDFNASLSSGEYTLAMRDYYGDVSLDEDKEFRLRFGQSKVPFGWENLQSSQNRAPMERADAINSAAEGERDIGVFGYWAPAEIRARFQELVRSGLKGSGDYGVAGLGAYSGQGLNKLDLNGEPHLVARLTYPWKLAGGQYFETGIQAYHGRFLSSVSAINLGSGPFTPTRPDDGLTDQRIGATFVWYPQPFGLEAEWNVGRGPELDPASRSLESQFLHGGYVQAAYRIAGWHGDWYPFARWQYYDGGRKFATNSPHETVNEWDVGIEWQPWPSFEVTVSYTRTLQRTNTRVAPYADTEEADRLAFQAQLNF